jgi:dTDP-4-dehydrorhamnose reductase
LKILIIAKNSFLAKQIKDYFFNSEYDLHFSSREDFDLTSAEQTRNFFNVRHYDVVVNCAINGGIRGKEDTLQDFLNNIQMFKNLVDNRDGFGKLINFGSGAEFDRSLDIDSCSEEQIFSRSPKDYYGLSKNIITRIIYKYDKFFNIRIFGCFGKHEKEGRFLKTNIKNALSNEPLNVHQDRFMDYISADDLCKILKFYFDNDIELLPKDLNAVYKKKYTLKQLAKMVKFHLNSESEILIQQEGLANSYTGSSERLSKMDIKLSGLEKEVERFLKQGE